MMSKPRFIPLLPVGPGCRAVVSGRPEQPTGPGGGGDLEVGEYYSISLVALGELVEYVKPGIPLQARSAAVGHQLHGLATTGVKVGNADGADAAGH
jgi:hypothetical protein